jgi:hypothetical protein
MTDLPDDFFESSVWPFKHMVIGQVVKLEDRDALRAQRTAHAYASAQNPRWKFKTKTDKATGILYVKRIA